jgi:hypothetical protein
MNYVCIDCSYDVVNGAPFYYTKYFLTLKRKDTPSLYYLPSLKVQLILVNRILPKLVFLFVAGGIRVSLSRRCLNFRLGA